MSNLLMRVFKKSPGIGASEGALIMAIVCTGLALGAATLAADIFVSLNTAGAAIAGL